MQNGRKLELYQSLYRIRAAEQAIQREYPCSLMKTPMHMSIGEEGIVAGVCTALKGRARFYGTYRSHALYIAVTEETDGFFAELYGKDTGPAGGKAGSMHLASPEHDLVMTSAVVGTTIPVAVGSAFEQKYRTSEKISVVFFGDGAADEGVFWESLNLACLWKLPVLFVCEDNGLAIHAPKYIRRGYASLKSILEQFPLIQQETKTTDAEAIHDLTIEITGQMREHQMPGFLLTSYYRYLEHVGVNEDFAAGYRSRGEFERWRKEDPVELLRKKLLNCNNDSEVTAIERAVDEQVAISVQKAKEAPFPKPADLYKGVFSG